MKKIKEISVITSTYKDKNGQEKKRYQTIGNLFEDGEYLKIKIDVIPLVKGGWEGWANCYDIDEEKAHKAPKVGFEDMPSDIPF
jgi:hypothetical protein